jgi:hypothetical protein
MSCSLNAYVTVRILEILKEKLADSQGKYDAESLFVLAKITEFFEKDAKE